MAVVLFCYLIRDDESIVVIVIFQQKNLDLRRQPALPDARGNAVDERGDRRRTPLQLEEPPTRVQDVDRHDVETTAKKNKCAAPVAPKTLKDVPAESESTARPEETTPVSTTMTSQPTTRDDITQETIAELTPENPTANDPEPIAELQNADQNEQELETNGEDLQQSYVMIETISTAENADLEENSPRENKTSATTHQVAQVTEFVKKLR